jgi:hypothetical protein
MRTSLGAGRRKVRRGQSRFRVPVTPCFTARPVLKIMPGSESPFVSSGQAFMQVRLCGRGRSLPLSRGERGRCRCIQPGGTSFSHSKLISPIIAVRSSPSSISVIKYVPARLSTGICPKSVVVLIATYAALVFAVLGITPLWLD